MYAWTLALTLAACDGSHTDHEPAAHATTDDHAAGALELSRNDGARWKMDDHTRSVFAETRTTLAGAAPATLDEAHALGDALDAQRKRLISGCTMEGAAHDELHAFLTAWMPAVAALQRSPDLPAAHRTVAKLQGMAATYDETFE